MALGLWAPYVLRSLRLKRGDTFIDVGAHIGYYSRYSARRVGPEGLVLCAEPDPRNLAVLRKNTSSFPQVVVIPKACGKAPGVGRLMIATDPELSRIADRDPEGVEVEINSLDALAEDFLSGRSATTKCVLKIDVEGSGLDVIDGARLLIESIRPDIIIEAFGEQVSAIKNALPRYSVERSAESYYYLTPHAEPG